MSHAYLSPSAAERWMHCPGAPRLELSVPGDGGSDYADEGTRAHEAAADTLEYARMVLESGGTPSAEDIRATLERSLDSPDDVEAVAQYAAAVLNRRGHGDGMAVEYRVDASGWIFGRGELYGTADALLWDDEGLDVFDLKFGRGVRVSAVRNPQLMIYALGAMDAFRADYSWSRVYLHIVQPRLGNYSEWSISRDDLVEWGREVLRPAALKALGPEPHTVPGTHCRFCRARAICRSVADGLRHTVEALPDPLALTPAEVASALPMLPQYKAWIAAVESWALQAALGGTRFPGMSLVRTTGRRMITAPDVLQQRLQAAGIAPDAYMAPPEMLSLTAIEKNIGRRRVAELGEGIICKSMGRPALATADDPRPDWDGAATPSAA